MTHWYKDATKYLIFLVKSYYCILTLFAMTYMIFLFKLYYCILTLFAMTYMIFLFKSFNCILTLFAMTYLNLCCLLCGFHFLQNSEKNQNIMSMSVIYVRSFLYINMYYSKLMLGALFLSIERDVNTTYIKIYLTLVLSHHISSY